MGWLRESMEQAGIRSFGELARQALAHPEWPDDSKARPRSLEAIFGRLDRREDLEWLSDRPGIQQILAELLKLSVSEIRTLLVDGTGLRSTVTRLRLDELRAARSFDLTQEPLLPSIPGRMSFPATWQRCCWLAKSGAGFGLVGHWLAARGLAQCAGIESEDELAKLPTSGAPLFLEANPELLDALANWRGSRPLCVAIAAEPSPSLIERSRRLGFEPLLSEPIAACLEQVADWVLFRLPGHPQSLRQSMLEWLKTGPATWGVLHTLGDALGFIGVYVEGSLDLQRIVSKDAFLTQWVRHRASELTRDRHRDLSSLRKALPGVLLEMAQTVLLDEGRSLSHVRTIDEWLALVPEHHRRGPDMDWLTARLVAENLPMRERDLERAAQRLPPGAHRIIVAMRDMGLLRPSSAHGFVIRPHFLARLVEAVAKDEVASATPLLWGEALLRPVARAALLPNLLARALKRPETLAEEVLEHIEPESPASVCAFEVAFVRLGLAVLLGADLNEQLSTALLEEQEALLLSNVRSVPVPRMLPEDPAESSDTLGAFYLAAWALSEQARLRGSSDAPLLDPWHAKSLPSSWPALLDIVAESLTSSLESTPVWLPGAIRLLDRLRHSVGAHVADATEPHPIFLAGILLDSIELGVLDFIQFCDWLERPLHCRFFRASARVREVNAERLALGIFTSWSEAGKPTKELGVVLARLPEVIAVGPPALIADAMLSGLFVPFGESTKDLPSSIWQAWVEARGNMRLDAEPVEPWHRAPESFVESALSTNPPTRLEIRSLVWSRHAEVALGLVERLKVTAPLIAAEWIEATPTKLVGALAVFATRHNWLHASAEVAAALARALHRGIAKREDQWQLAYELLANLEIERRRFEFTG